MDWINDLQTRYPEIAQEANGWDPKLVLFGTTEKRPWKCELGHEYEMPVIRRTHGVDKQGCPYCANQKVLAGFNDLASKYPEVATEACGWDPTQELSKSGKKLSWRCNIGHNYKMTIGNRTIQNQGCPYCSNMKVLKGFNDLETTHPAIALQADGWLPGSIVAGTNKMKSWICELGHQWSATPDERTRGGTGCPYCCNKIIMPGFNDLETHQPEIAAEAFGWDPSKLHLDHQGNFNGNAPNDIPGWLLMQT